MAYRENYLLIDWKPRPPLIRPRPVDRRSLLPCPHIASDGMEPTQHMCDGKFYTSKAKFRAVTRAHGCVEVGNDPARLRPHKKPRPDRRAIKDAVEKAVARFSRGERA